MDNDYKVEFLLQETSPNVYINKSYRSKFRYSVQYFIEGNPECVKTRVLTELSAYPPQGYSTRFEKVFEDSSRMVVTGYRQDSCD
jgi:hypothetical protein